MTEHSAARSPSRTVLKLLSGLQQGAEAQLADGTTYLIGSADECDIVLQAEGVAPKHLTLAVQSGQIRLEVQEQPVIVGDRSLPPGHAADFPAGVVIRLGEVCIGVGPEDADWSQAVLPDKIKAPEVAEASALPEAPDGRETAGEAESGETPPSSSLSPTVEESPALPVAPRSPVKKWLTLCGIVIVVLTLMVGWRPFTAWLNMGAATDSAILESSAIEKTHAILTELGLQDITVAARPDGGVILTGYCATRDVKNRLTAALLAQGVRVENRLWPEEVLKDAIAQTLERLGGKILRYTYSGKGVLHLRGVLRADLSDDELLSTLRNDVPGITRIESTVKTIEDFATDLRGQARQAGLEARVAITVASATGLLATGALDTEGMERWNAIAQSFMAETQGIPTLDRQILLSGAAPISQPVVEVVQPVVQPVVEAVQPVVVERVIQEQPAAPLRMVVRGIVTSPGQVPYALLDDGTRIAEGDRIQDYYMVEKIHFNRVIVRDGSNRKVFYVGDSKHDRR